MNLKKLLPVLFVLASLSASANYMLIQNVSKVGNNPTAKTIQIQFDISWQNSWRDSINYDAAWIFIKYKDASGLWQHAKLSLSGYQNGTGTANSLSVQSDSVGAYMYRNALGNGTFSSTGVQLQWNYGQYGLTDVSAFEVRVFAIEMVYVPQGDFTIPPTFYDGTYNTNGNYSQTDFLGLVSPYSSYQSQNIAVINSKLSPSLQYATGFRLDTIYFDPTCTGCGYYSSVLPSDTARIRIKGDAGIDSNNDGIVDNTNYPTGYKAFYCYKYELSEEQYADFFNTLTPTQQDSIGIAGSYNLYLNKGVYYSRTPNKACGNATEQRVLAYTIWSGMRPMTILEFNKASYGPQLPVLNYSWNYIYLQNPINQQSVNSGIYGYPAWCDATSFSIPSVYSSYGNGLSNVGSMATSTSTRSKSGASYYGIMDLTGNAVEPVTKLTDFNFTSQNGKGILSANGNPYNIPNWKSNMLIFVDQVQAIVPYNQFNLLNASSGYNNNSINGFRYVRSAE